MRIPIRVQLAALVLLSTLTSLAVLSIATWVTNYNRVVGMSTDNLGLVASLKAAELSSNLDLMSRSVRSLSTRLRLQAALQLYNNGTNATAAFGTLATDLSSALAVGQQEVLTLQAMLFPNNSTGVVGRGQSLLNTTGTGINIELPYYYANGTQVRLGDANFGYPPNMYPNFTFTSQGVPTFLGLPLSTNSSILLGPWETNETFALVSITLPVINNTSATDIMGYMTVVLDARLIFQVLNSPVGLGETGTMLLVGPDTINNRFPGTFENATLPILYDLDQLKESLVRFALPPNETYSEKRHPRRNSSELNTSFNITSYPYVLDAISTNQNQINNAGGQISTTNEEGYAVAVGYAIPATSLCAWVLLLEESRGEAFASIVELRHVLLACIFATFGAVILVVVPVAHYSSRPIRRLRDATAQTIQSPDSRASNEKGSSGLTPDSTEPLKQTNAYGNRPRKGRRWLSSWRKSSRNREDESHFDGAGDPEAIRTTYAIPHTVTEKKHLIQDELTDLTQYFNEMSGELVLNYGRLEERVKQRTAELEASKVAAEAANESKTLFIANISHELKTPLNGILGMCAVCMQDDDPVRIKRSLEIIYRSGDLLHNLLTDLLTFSKNQAGQKLTLDEKEFYIRDVGTQVQAIFDKQIKDAHINFSIVYEGPRDGLDSHGVSVEKSYGPPGSGRVKDMCLWGDYHRILQVVINLVSNSLKFTPEGGSVRFTIRCAEEILSDGRSSRRNSEQSNQSNRSSKRPWTKLLSRNTPDFETTSSDETKVNGNSNGMVEIRKQLSQTSVTAEPAGPMTAGLNERILCFDFEVDDTGPGVAESLQEKIFEPFVQGDLRLTKKYGGTGLGLSICQQLAKLMGGSVKLRSELGRGSTFTLQIPLRHLRNRVDSSASSMVDVGHALSRTSTIGTIQPAPTGTQSPVKATAPSNKDTPFEHEGKPRLVGLSQPYFSSAAGPMVPADLPKGKSRLRVLVAEDNKVNQEVVLRMLRLEEIFDVTVAQDGQEALELVQESVEACSPYDLILMDVMMPRLGGHDSTRMIRDLGFSAPIVALTAFTDEVNEKQCKDSGMDYFLAKPLRRPALKHVLNTFCSTIREVDEAEVRSGDVSPLSAGTSSQSPPGVEQRRVL